MMRTAGRGFPVEEFLQALTAQLDRAQDALALKVSGTNRPLTWALKDLSIDLRVFVEVSETGKVLWRSAGPNEEGASTVHLDLTTITRSMVEENTFAFHEDADPRPLAQLPDATPLDEDDARKLDWMGVRTVGQLRQLDPLQVQAVMNIPVSRLQAALAAAAEPAVVRQEVIERDGSRLLALHGANLAPAPAVKGSVPEVRLAGTPVEVVEQSPRRLLVRPLPTHLAGAFEVVANGKRTSGTFDLGRPAPPEGGAP